MNRRTLILLVFVSIFGCRQSAETATIQPGEAHIPATVSAERRTPVVQVVHEILPAVVNIETEAVMRHRTFDPWFGMFPRERAYKTQAVGSGFIWASDGIIVTNAHVVEAASQIVVNLQSGEKLPAKVIGIDPDSDLAVLQVEAKNLPAAPIGTSSDLLIGETVIAIGNPFGLSGSVTTGVISATGRSVPAQDGERIFTDFIQTDASINPGNSGGPLVNIEGKVIGINVAIYAEAQNIGFAIPVDRATKIIEDLRKYGEVHKAWVGLVTATVTPEEARRVGFAVERGAIITRLFNGSPAEKAGLRAGDVIVAANGKPIDTREALNTIFATATSGQTIQLGVQREDQSLELTVVATNPPDDLGLRVLAAVSGIQVENARRAVVITDVERRSRAAAVGLQAGDFIVGINGVEIGSVDDLNAALVKSIDRSSIVLSIARGRYVYTLSFPMGM